MSSKGEGNGKGSGGSDPRSSAGGSDPSKGRGKRGADPAWDGNPRFRRNPTGMRPRHVVPVPSSSDADRAYNTQAAEVEAQRQRAQRDAAETRRDWPRDQVLKLWWPYSMREMNDMREEFEGSFFRRFKARVNASGHHIAVRKRKSTTNSVTGWGQNVDDIIVVI